MTIRFSKMAAAVMFAGALAVSAKSIADERAIFVNGARTAGNAAIRAIGKIACSRYRLDTIQNPVYK